MSRRRPGRARRHDRRRTPSGQLSRAGHRPVGPTAELLRHRKALAGSQADPTLAESPLGALLARDLITAEERMAGQRFAWLHRLAIGRVHPLASDPAMPRELPGAGPATPALGAGQAAWRAAREADFDRLRTALKAEGGGVYNAVLDVAVMQCFPDWIVAGRALLAADARELEALQRGLALLAHLLGLTARDRAGRAAARQGRCRGAR